MFHRVKSDVQKPQPVAVESADTAVKERTAPSVQDSLIVASKAQIQQQASSPAASASNDQPPSKKDTVMSEDTTSSSASDTEASPKSVDIPGAAYQQQPAARPASPYANPNYPGFSAPPNAAAASVQAAAPKVEKSEVERRLVIGQGISMSGQIESCDYLLVEGTIEAALKGARLLEVSETGNFYGTVEIDEATIAGRFEGDLTVNGRLTVKSGGVIMGSITYKELEIQAGAIIDGKISPLRAAGDSSEKKPVRAKAAGSTPSKVSKDAPHQPANNDGQLFASVASTAE